MLKPSQELKYLRRYRRDIMRLSRRLVRQGSRASEVACIDFIVELDLTIADLQRRTAVEEFK